MTIIDDAIRAIDARNGISAQKLLQAIGTSPDEMSKSILKQLRSGGKMTPESLASVLVSSFGTSMSFTKNLPIRKLFSK